MWVPSSWCILQFFFQNSRNKETSQSEDGEPEKREEEGQAKGEEEMWGHKVHFYFGIKTKNRHRDKIHSAQSNKNSTGNA